MMRNRSTPERFSIRRRILSFGPPLNGLRVFLKEEHNSRIHLVATVAMVLTGILLRISTTQWVILALTIGMVWCVELLNTAVENICDFISPEKHALIGKIKDISAAAVLITSTVSIIVGLIMFLPILIIKLT